MLGSILERLFFSMKEKAKVVLREKEVAPRQALGIRAGWLARDGAVSSVAKVVLGEKRFLKTGQRSSRWLAYSRRRCFICR
jgi:hypothetical protein